MGFWIDTEKGLLISIFIGVAVSVALVLIGDIGQVSSNLSKLSAPVILILVSLTFCNQLLRFVKWEYLRKKLGIAVGARASFMIFFSGFVFSATPAKAGELMKAYFLRKASGTGLSKGVALVIGERVSDVIGLTILAVIGLAGMFAHAETVAIFVILMGAGIFAVTSDRTFAKLLPLAGRFIGKGKAQKAEGLRQEMKVLFRKRTLFVSGALSSVSWSSECIALFLLLGYLGADVPLLSSFFIFSFSSIFGSLLVLPGGLGVAEGSFMALLLLSGASWSVSSAATIVIRIATLWFGVCVGLVALAVAKKRRMF